MDYITLLDIANPKKTKDTINALVQAYNNVVERTDPYPWREYNSTDWVQTPNYYKLVIPINTHQCANPYLAEMLILKDADSQDSADIAGYENVIAAWKRLSNDSIIIKSDQPIACKILIKGDREWQ